AAVPPGGCACRPPASPRPPPRSRSSRRASSRRSRSTACAVSTDGPVFNPELPHRCSPQVALRPEPFGALVYHFATGRLSVVETQQLVEVASGLERLPSVHAAIEAAGVEEALRPAYLRARAGLVANGAIEGRP